MKRGVFFVGLVFCTVLLFVCFGCATKENGQLTPQQIEQIKSEVKAVGDVLIAKMNTLDWDGIMKCYADMPDFVMFNPDGSRFDFQMFKKFSAEFVPTAAAYKWTAIRQDLLVLSKDYVVAAWVGKDEYVMKSGAKLAFDPHAYTLIYKKIGGQWKIVYSHDSTNQGGKL